MLNLKPKGMPWSFVADTNLIAWLHRIGQPFDVITDEVLHRDGAAALAGIPGGHHRHASRVLLDRNARRLARLARCGWPLDVYGRQRFLLAHRVLSRQSGDHRSAPRGRRHPRVDRRTGRVLPCVHRRIRRTLASCRASPQQLVGIGFAAQGFDGGTHYRICARRLRSARCVRHERSGPDRHHRRARHTRRRRGRRRNRSLRRIARLSARTRWSSRVPKTIAPVCCA